MPLKWVEPDVYLTHRGINIYNTYKSEDYSNPYTFFFTTDINERDEECEFDIRDLPDVNKDNFEDVLKKAIDDKKLKLPEHHEGYTH